MPKVKMNKLDKQVNKSITSQNKPLRAKSPRFLFRESGLITAKNPWFAQSLNQFLKIALLLFAVVFLAFWQTLQMYFWKDDSALMFKAQNPQVEAGFWGRGMFGEGPYRHILEPFVFLYPILGLEPTGYFAAGIIFYFLAALSVFYLAKVIFQDLRSAILAALVFSAGYIGSETIFGLTNSLQTSRGIAMAALMMAVYIRFLREKQIVLYLISLLLFFFTLDTVYIRSHGLIFTVVAADLLFSGFPLDKKKILWFALRVVPFLAIFYRIYLATVSVNFAASGALSNILQGDFTPVTSPIISLGNLFLPEPWLEVGNQWLKAIFGFNASWSLSGLLAGILLLILLVILVLYNFAKKNNYWKITTFSFVWIIANVLLYFSFDTKQVLGSSHRYYSYSSVGWAILVATAAQTVGYLFKRYQLLPTYLIITVCIVYLAIGNQIQYDIVTKRSQPARRFFNTLKNTLADIPKGSLVYFDVHHDVRVQSEFGDFFGAGSMPETTVLAIYYGRDRYDFELTYDFSQVVKELSQKSISSKQLFTFFYDRSGLVNTTDQARRVLSEGFSKSIPIEQLSASTQFNYKDHILSTKTKFEPTQTGTDHVDPRIDINFNREINSIAGATLEFDMALTPLMPNGVVFPYGESRSSFSISDSQLLQTLMYLKDRLEFRRSAQVISMSFWQDQVPQNLNDGRLDTTWLAHRGAWNSWVQKTSMQAEYVMVDLGMIKSVGRLIWTNGHTTRTPTHYLIYTSINGENWQTAGDIKLESALPSNQVSVDDFPERLARFVKMEIIDSSGGDAPQLAEIEVVAGKYKNIDLNLAHKLSISPFASIGDLSQWSLALAWAADNISAQIWWKSNKDLSWNQTSYQDFPVIADGRFYHYRLDIPAGGTVLEAVRLDKISIPVEVKIKNVKMLTDPLP